MLVNTSDGFNLESRQKLRYKLYCSTRHICIKAIFLISDDVRKLSKAKSKTTIVNQVGR